MAQHEHFTSGDWIYALETTKVVFICQDSLAVRVSDKK